MGIVVIYAVRPKPGKTEEVRKLLERHVPTLRREGLITERPSLLLWADKDGAFIESFEWASVELSRRAESTISIQEIWAGLAQASEFVPLASLGETSNTFAHFRPV